MILSPKSNEFVVEERSLWLAWSRFPGIGPVLLKRLHQHFGSLQAAWQASAPDLQRVEGIGEALLATIQAQRSRLDPIVLLNQHEQQNPNFWTPADPAYPRLLWEIPDPPPVLYYRGQVAPLENRGNTPTVAIVGTRDPSEYGKRWTRKLAQALAEQGVTVVSGLAEGIDTQAHLACLEAGGRTLAVLGTGVDQVYPPRNRGLYQRIVEGGGLVLSEYAAGTQPNRAHFPRRNRIIAGLSRATLVLEAPTKSGALITAHLANDYGREVWVLPGSLDNPRALGCLGLVNRGAQVILSEGHLLEALGALPVLDRLCSQRPELSEIPQLEPELAQVLRAIADLSGDFAGSSIPFDSIVEATQLPPGAASAALLQLELLSLIAQQAGMRYQYLG